MRQGIVQKRVLAFFFLLGIGLRLFLVFAMPIRDTVSGEPEEFDRVASSVVSGGGLSKQLGGEFRPLLDRPPVYFLFVAALYKLFGHAPEAVRLAQIVLDLGSCLLVWKMTRDLFGERVARWAFGAVCLNPFLAVYTPALLPVTLTAFLLTASVFFMVRAGRSSNTFLYVVAGLFLGMLMLCREENQLIPFLFALLLFVKLRRRALRQIMALAVGLIFLMFPWWVRNFQISGRFIPVTYGSAKGRAFYFSTVQQVFANDENYFEMLPGDLQTLWNQANSSDSEKIHDAERRFAEIGWQNIKQNPVGFLFRRLVNYPKFWIGIHPDEFVILESGKLRAFHPDVGEMWRSLVYEPREIAILGLKYLLLLLSAAFVVLAGYGLWVSRGGDTNGLLYAKLAILYYAVIFFPVVVETRYSVPTHPLLALFAALAVSRLLREKTVAFRAGLVSP